MQEKQLINISIPSAIVRANTSDGNAYELSVNYGLEKRDNELWHLKGIINCNGVSKEDTILLETEEIMDILDDTLSVDEYCQDEEFQKHQKRLAERLSLSLLGDEGLNVKRERLEINLEPYVLQQHVSEKKGDDLLSVFVEHIRKSNGKRPIPYNLRVNAPKNFIPDLLVLESLQQRIYEGTPAIALLGPTGSGKSAMARYLGAQLNNEGYGIYVIDGNARLEGDRLFDREDFDQNGTFVLEGVLCRLAKETRKLGIKLIVVLEEYNAFTDETRREFYRLFSDEDRYYTIQSSKYGRENNTQGAKVDFSHVQFIITANPLTSDRYLTDDLKRLSNAESRRLVIIYQDYAKEPKTIKKILKSLITKKQAYGILKQRIPDIDDRINWQMGVDIFRALTDTNEGDNLGYDVGYTSVADFLWTATLRGHQNNRYAIAISEHILNAIPDINIRALACERIRQAVNIIVPNEYIIRGT